MKKKSSNPYFLKARILSFVYAARRSSGNFRDRLMDGGVQIEARFV